MEITTMVVETSYHGRVTIKRSVEYDIDANTYTPYVTLSSDRFGIFFVLKGGDEIYDFLTSLQIVISEM